MSFITPEAMLTHWQGHRRLTRRVINVFPDDQLFSFSVGGMRPFGALALEMITMAAPMVRSRGCLATRLRSRNGSWRGSSAACSESVTPERLFEFWISVAGLVCPCRCGETIDRSIRCVALMSPKKC